MSSIGFKKWIEYGDSLEHIGKLAVFYLPSNKLTNKVRKEIHDFFVSRHKAYTHELSDIKGYWHDGKDLLNDSHERYEISFKGKEKFKEFLDFLSNLCENISEKSIYLTMGEESFLVKPKKPHNPRV